MEILLWTALRPWCWMNLINRWKLVWRRSVAVISALPNLKKSCWHPQRINRSAPFIVLNEPQKLNFTWRRWSRAIIAIQTLNSPDKDKSDTFLSCFVIGQPFYIIFCNHRESVDAPAAASGKGIYNEFIMAPWNSRRGAALCKFRNGTTMY